MSLSARRAWIEIFISREMSLIRPVALRKESVDRNADCFGKPPLKRGVALRKESVDRNHLGVGLGVYAAVALRKESVDRNAANERTHDQLARRSPQGERG